MAPAAAREERRDTGRHDPHAGAGRRLEKARGRIMLLRPFVRQSARGAERRGELQELLGGLADPDRLDVGEFADAVGAKLAAVARGFDAAEGNAGIGDYHLVNEDHSRL